MEMTTILHLVALNIPMHIHTNKNAQQNRFILAPKEKQALKQQGWKTSTSFNIYNRLLSQLIMKSISSLKSVLYLFSFKNS